MNNNDKEIIIEADIQQQVSYSTDEILKDISFALDMVSAFNHADTVSLFRTDYTAISSNIVLAIMNKYTNMLDHIEDYVTTHDKLSLTSLEGNNKYAYYADQLGTRFSKATVTTLDLDNSIIKFKIKITLNHILTKIFTNY